MFANRLDNKDSMLLYFYSHTCILKKMDKKTNRRSSERITTGYKTGISYDNKSYSGIVENLSASGANVLTDPIDDDVEFLDGEPLELEFETHTGKTALLKCTVIWSSKIPPNNVRHRIGIKIIDLPMDKFDFSL